MRTSVQPTVNRSAVLDIAKGIGILSVVWAHAKAPFTTYIYQFNMPFFFLISGYLFSKERSFWDFFKRKVYSLYIPFVFWNLLSEFLCWCFGIREYTLASFCDQAVKILLTLSKDDKFYGATWFLGALFTVSILYKLLWQKITLLDKQKSLALLGFFAVIMLTGYQIRYYYHISRTMILTFFYALGVVTREHRDTLSHLDKPVVGVFCAIYFLAVASRNSIDMGRNEYRYFLPFLTGAICCSYAVICISRFLATKCPAFLGKVLALWGRKSLDIVLWQFVAFRIVIALQIHLAGEPLSDLLKYYPVYSESNGWWLLYLATGILVPVLFGALLRAGFWGKFIKRLHLLT